MLYLKNYVDFSAKFTLAQIKLTLKQVSWASLFPLAIHNSCRRIYSFHWFTWKITYEKENKREYLTINAHAYLALGELYSRQAQWSLSFYNIKKSKTLFEKQNDFNGAAKCENLLGTIYGDLGYLKNARAHFEKGLSLIQGEKKI